MPGKRLSCLQVVGVPISTLENGWDADVVVDNFRSDWLVDKEAAFGRVQDIEIGLDLGCVDMVSRYDDRLMLVMGRNSLRLVNVPALYRLITDNRSGHRDLSPIDYLIAPECHHSSILILGC